VNRWVCMPGHVVATLPVGYVLSPVLTSRLHRLCPRARSSAWEMKPIANAAPLIVTAVATLSRPACRIRNAKGGDDHGHGSSADASLFVRKSHGNVEPVRVASDPNQRMVNLGLTAYHHAIAQSSVSMTRDRRSGKPRSMQLRPLSPRRLSRRYTSSSAAPRCCRWPGAMAA
jgi:hypothetical protein